MEEKAGEVTTRQLGSATSKEGVPSTSASETGRSRDLLTADESKALDFDKPSSVAAPIEAPPAYAREGLSYLSPGAQKGPTSIDHVLLGGLESGAGVSKAPELPHHIALGSVDLQAEHPGAALPGSKFPTSEADLMAFMDILLPRSAEQEVNCGKQKALGGGTSNLKKTMEYLDETPAFLVPDGTDSSGQDAQPDRGSKSVDSLPESASESQDQACQSPEISIQNPVAQKTPDAEVTPPTSRSPKPNTPHHGVCRSPVAGSSGGGNGIGDHQLPQAILSSTDGRSQTRTAARRLSLESQPSVTDQQGLQHQGSLNLQAAGAQATLSPAARKRASQAMQPAGSDNAEAMAGRKQCTCCDRLLDRTEFWMRTASADKLQFRCKECHYMKTQESAEKKKKLEGGNMRAATG